MIIHLFDARKYFNSKGFFLTEYTLFTRDFYRESRGTRKRTGKFFFSFSRREPFIFHTRGDRTELSRGIH